jgi:hypothetical protein
MTSVLAAHFFARIELKNSLFNMRWITIPQTIVLIAAWLFAAVIFTWYFPLSNILLCIVGLIGLGIFIWALFKKFDLRLSRFLWISLASSLSINILMSTWFYPSVLNYQSSSQMGTWIKTNNLSHLPLYITKVNGRALDVYAQKRVIGVESSQLDSIVLAQKEVLVFTDQVGLDELKTSKNSCKILKTMSDYPATLLSLNFANPSIRQSILGKRFLIKVSE